MEESLGFKSVDEFSDYLKGYVDLSSWGVNGAKSPAELYKELRDGDSGLVTEKNGLLRLTWPLFVDVSYRNQNVDYSCFEAENKKGKFRNLPGTSAEKRQANEKIDDAIRRTYEEEIVPSFYKSRLSLKDSTLNFERDWQENTSARSYPGLQTRSLNTLYLLQVAPNQGLPQPLELVEKNGTSKFDWKVNG